MKNKTLGWGILLCILLALLTGLLGIESERFEILIRVFLMFFGIWGGIRLIKSEKTDNDDSN